MAVATSAPVSACVRHWARRRVQLTCADLAGSNPGLGLFPGKGNVDSECTQKGAQIDDDRECVASHCAFLILSSAEIQIDYTYSFGPPSRVNHTYNSQRVRRRRLFVLSLTHTRSSSRRAFVWVDAGSSTDLAQGFATNFEEKDDQYILARYSTGQPIASVLFPYGKGTVALTGVHPEADASWYEGNPPVSNTQGASPT